MFQSLQQLLAVFVGGGLGSLARFGVSRWVSHAFETALPLATLLVNALGCFIIGASLAWFEQQRLQGVWPLLIATGFCGGFTTFSSFAYENKNLLEQQNYTTFLLYTLLSLGLGFLAAFLGVIWVKQGWR